MPRDGLARKVLLAVTVVSIWAAFDLVGPRHADIRVFDPDQVARLDTAMWRSYYDRKPLPLYFELASLLRKEFHFPLLRSHLTAARAARAAFTFKRGHDRADYQRALPDLIDYYRDIRAISTTPFDPERAARLELEWWIVHRAGGGTERPDLERAVAEAAAALYGVPAGALAHYAHARTVAMVLRDGSEAHGGLDAAGWGRIEALLQDSWRSLSAAVRPASVAARKS